MREYIDPLDDGIEEGESPSLLVRLCRPFVKAVVFGALFAGLILWLALRSLKHRILGG